MFEISGQPLIREELSRSINDVGAGGFVTFEGWVRNSNEGRAVEALEYEAFPELAAIEAEKIFAECRARFKIRQARCVHRVGHLALGDLAVWIGVASSHRDEAYRASRFLIDEIKLRLPIWKKEHYADGHAEWVNCQQCYAHAHHHGASDESAYYSRQVAVRGVGPAGQARLKDASVLVIGAGGLGSPVLQTLAASGVGAITIVESDVLEISNLHRQTLYRYADRGRAKVFLAQEALRGLNPFIEVRAVHERLDFARAQELVAGTDLVVECTDNFLTKFLVHDVCFAARVPLVAASVYQLEGELQAYIPDSSEGCLRCQWPTIPAEDCVANCAEAGVLGAVPTTVGTLQAKLALDILLGRPVDTRRMLIDVDHFAIDKLTNPKNPACWLCGESRRELQPELYAAASESWEIRADRLEALARNYVLVDLRERDERSTAGTVNAALAGLALSEVKDWTALDPAKQYLLICQRGRRSRVLTRALREQNLHQFFSLQNGVNGLE